MKKIFQFVFILLHIFFSTVTLFPQSDKHVILVIIDGARYSETLGDPLFKFIPRMHQLADEGVVLDSMFNDNITLTKRAIPAIWCGSWAPPKDTTVNGIANQYAVVPTVWEYFRKTRNLDSTHAMYIMKMLSSPWIQSFVTGYGPAYWPWYILQGSKDPEVWENSKQKLEQYHPELDVIYLSDVDSAPSEGWDAYTKAITIADSIVGMLWDFVQSDPVYQNKTTLLVTNDHGRHLDNLLNGFVSHGDKCMGCQHIMLLGVGADMPKGLHTSIRRTITDITPTIGVLLNFPTPFSTGEPITEIITSIEKEKENKTLLPKVSLEQNYPNPFNPNTVIKFTTTATAYITLSIYDVLGNEVTKLVACVMPGGAHEADWNAVGFASGIYNYRLTVGNYSLAKKLLLLK